MLVSFGSQQLHAAAATCEAAGTADDAARVLAAGHEAEALDFLSARPLHTVYMAGFIRDNGLVSPLNRGAFYGSRDAAGRLAGVALVGHVTQVEARTPDAAGAGGAAAAGLRPATPEDLPLVLPAQAAMAVEECGVNPLEVDPQGFRERCARRIGRGRVWVAVGAGGGLDFKADVMAETPEAVYLEGVYVRPGARGTGLGRRCMTQLARELLARSRAVCLLVNESNLEAQSFYRKLGFGLRGLYETIYLHKTHA
ncbi:MAG: GNAT family N-acetyltransferase [Acidobacteria bacterium]|nr:GNAT family N-acetyltransferase [Acidobacteriota bacterium]